MEDLKTPIMTTKYNAAYLSGGCWSPTRPGVFFTIKIDGTLDVWDIFLKQNEPAFSTKVRAAADGGDNADGILSNGARTCRWATAL
jgi:hypothetical protein